MPLKARSKLSRKTRSKQLQNTVLPERFHEQNISVSVPIRSTSEARYQRMFCRNCDFQTVPTTLLLNTSLRSRDRVASNIVSDCCRWVGWEEIRNDAFSGEGGGGGRKPR